MTDPPRDGPPDRGDELLAVAAGLRAEARGLLASLRPGAPERFVRVAEQMAARGRQFADRVEAGRIDLLDRAHRHDLRADLALVIGYAELWFKRAAQFGVVAHADALERVLAAARRALALVDARVAALTPAAAAPPSAGGPAAFVPLAERGRLLVVDDNRANRDLLQALLEQLGHHVTVAASGQEALTLVGSAAFDLILLDVLMPGMDGFAVLERLKANASWQHIPVLMVSALDRVDSVIAGIARGAEDYLTRPFNELLLRARVGACLEKKRLRDREQEHLRCIDRLLHAIFPPEVVAELTDKGFIVPRRHDKVGVCFMDVVGFTSFCDRHADRPEEVVRLLEWYVEVFEQVARRHGVQKIKTIGDAFLMVSGLLRPVDNPVLQLVRCADEVLRTIRTGPAGWQLRVGIHVGAAVAGTLGESQYSFDLWGSTVNIAARIESIGRPGAITLSEAAWEDVALLYRGAPHDAAIRGIGPMTIWEVHDPAEGAPR